MIYDRFGRRWGIRLVLKVEGSLVLRRIVFIGRWINLILVDGDGEIGKRFCCRLWMW